MAPMKAPSTVSVSSFIYKLAVISVTSHFFSEAQRPAAGFGSQWASLSASWAALALPCPLPQFCISVNNRTPLRTFLIK